ncbi:MAG: GxxExxY protein [Anaerolineae bacterium]
MVGVMEDYPDKDLTEKIIGAVFEVHNTLGVGFLEKVYQYALVKELKLRGYLAQPEVKYPFIIKMSWSAIIPPTFWLKDVSFWN